MGGRSGPEPFLGMSSGNGEQFRMGWFGSKLEGWSLVVGRLAWDD